MRLRMPACVHARVSCACVHMCMHVHVCVCVGSARWLFWLTCPLISSPVRPPLTPPTPAPTSSIHNAHLSSRKLAYILTKLQFPVTNPAFKVRNMIGTLDLGFPVRLEGIVYDHAKFASYEPELFPGLIYRCLSPKVVLLVFVSGKVVITGAKDEGDMARVMEKMFPVLEEYKKTMAGAQPPRTQQQVQQGQRLITQGGEAGQQQQQQQQQQNNNSSSWRRPEAV